MSLLRQNRRPLTVEALEDRNLLAVTASLLDGGHTLKLVGDNASELVWITQNDAADEIAFAWQPKVNGASLIAMPVQGQVYKSSDITRVIVNLKGGDDSLTWTLYGDMSHAKQIEVNLGKGTDQALFDFAGPVYTIMPVSDPLVDTIPVDPPVDAARPNTLNATLTIAVAGGSGRDSVETLIGNVGEGVNVAFLAQLGDGNDYGAMTLHGEVAAHAFVLTALYGGNGADTLTASTATNAGIAADGICSVLLDGQQGRDVVSQRFDGHLGGDLYSLLYGGAGKDNVSLRLLASWDSGGSATTQVRGGAGDDDLTLLAGVASPPPEIAFIQPWTPAVTFDNLMRGGGGYDHGEATANVRFNGIQHKTIVGDGWMTGG